MATTMDNLEKLIQMATIEQMYNMLNKLKENTSNIYKEDTSYNECSCCKQNTEIITKLSFEIKNLKLEINNTNEHLSISKEEYWKLSMKVSDVERELRDIKSNTNNNSKFLCQQIRGQQLLTSYPGFSNGSLTEGQDEAHIKLKIEEKNQNDVTINNSEEASIVQLTEEEYNEEDVNQLLTTCLTSVLDKTPTIVNETRIEDIKETQEELLETSDEEQTEEEVGTEEEESEEEESEEEESEEEESKEESKAEVEESKEEVEVEEALEKNEEENTSDKKPDDHEVEDNEELSSEEELVEHIEEKKDKEDEKDEDEKEEEEEEEEDVFEIEIDDVTYFATGEENGILYEMISDGEIGKKVGIIKDGEPIFN